MSEQNYWTRVSRRRLSRRTLLSVSARAGVGAAGIALVGCGDDDDDGPAAAQVAQQAQQQDQPAAQQQDQQQAAPQTEQQADQQAAQADADQQADQQAVQQQAAETVAAIQPPSGEVRWPTSTNVSGLEGTTGTGGGDHQILWPIFDNLVSYNSGLEPNEARSLAESWRFPTRCRSSSICGAASSTTT